MNFGGSGGSGMFLTKERLFFPHRPATRVAGFSLAFVFCTGDTAVAQQRGAAGGSPCMLGHWVQQGMETQWTRTGFSCVV